MYDHFTILRSKGLNCQLNEKDSRNVIFEVMINSKIFERLDLSNEFWSQINVHDTSTEKQVGLYEIENIENPNIVTTAVNLKEYFEKYRDKSFNKKHKGLKKDTPGMHFEAYANRVMLFNDFTNQKVKKIQQSRLQIKNTEVRMQSISKSQFAGLNDKRFHFYDCVVSMPFGHPLLEKLRKENKKETYIHLHIKGKREEYLNAEAKAVRQCEKLQVLGFILLQAPVLYKLDSNLMSKSITKLPTKNYVLNSYWL